MKNEFLKLDISYNKRTKKYFVHLELGNNFAKPIYIGTDKNKVEETIDAYYTRCSRRLDKEYIAIKNKLKDF